MTKDAVVSGADTSAGFGTREDVKSVAYWSKRIKEYSQSEEIGSGKQQSAESLFREITEIKNELEDKSKKLESYVSKQIETASEIESLHIRADEALEEKNAGKSDVYENAAKEIAEDIKNITRKLPDAGDIKTSLEKAKEFLKEASRKNYGESRAKLGGASRMLKRAESYLRQHANKPVESVEHEAYSMALENANKTIIRIASLTGASLKNARIFKEELYDNSEKNVPGNVPYYTPAPDEAQRRCATCRFFSTDNSTCTKYNFDANPDYVCAAWKGVDNAAKASEGETDWNPDVEEYEDPENVPVTISGEIIDEVSESFEYMSQDEEYNHDTQRYAHEQFKSGDVVYVRSTGDTGYVVKMSGDFVVIQHNSGKTLTVKGDITVKSNKSVKSNLRNAIAIKSEYNVSDYRKVAEDVSDMIKGFIDSHSEDTPYASGDVLDLKSNLRDVLSSDMFKKAGTGRKRKYYRAIQNAAYAVSSAYMVLHQGASAISTIEESVSDIKVSKKETQRIAEETQGHAQERIRGAHQHIKDALETESSNQ